MASRDMWLEPGEPFRRRVKLVRFWRIAILTFGSLLAWTMWGQIRLITSLQAEVRQLQEYIRHIEERLGILDQIHSHRPSLPKEEATAMAHAIQQEARRYDLEWQPLLAIIRVESGFDARARSPRGGRRPHAGDACDLRRGRDEARLDSEGP